MGSVETEPGGRRAERKAQNRAKLLDAARRVFAAKGLGEATARDIVRETDLASGTFYNYFPDKEAVLRALVERTAGEAARRTRAARRRAATAEELLEGGFRAYFELLVENRATFELMRRNAGTIRALFDEPAIGASTAQLADDLRDAVDAGILPPHDARLAAAAMVGATFEVGVRMLDDDPPDVEHAVRFCTGLFLGGLGRFGR
jgi:AcrR family transcriptional regulator